MKHANIKNVPYNPKEIYDYALSKSFENWIDEKGTKDNPGTYQRKPSKLNYKEAFNLILHNKPHWVISFRDGSLWNEKDYWEFGGCNMASNSYGEIFIWINVDVNEAEKIFTKFNLTKHKY
jgi:hypothetical protein